MKNHKFIAINIILLILIIYNNAFAVDKLIVSIIYGRVYATKESELNNKKVKLSPGDELYKQDTIHLFDNNSYIVLNYPPGGSPLELKVKGDYYVKDIIDHYKSESLDFIKTYWEMVMQKMRQSFSGFPGGPERGIEIISPEDKDYQIQVESPLTTKIIEPKLNLCWHKNEKVYIYRVIVLKIDEEVLSEFITSDTFAVIDLSSKALTPNTCYYWKVVSEENPNIISQKNCFLLLPPNNISIIKEEIEKINHTFNIDNSPLRNILLAQYFESNGLLMDAYQNYKMALSIAHYIKEYNNLFFQFCVRSGIR